MGKLFKTTPEINVEKNKEENRRKTPKRWSIKSCLAVFLAVVTTATTIHSQVLYAQAETGDAPDSRISFTFLPLEEGVRLQTLPVKGTLEETLEQLPKSLAITAQLSPMTPDPIDPVAETPLENDTPVSDISGNNTGSDFSELITPDGETVLTVTVPDTPVNSAPEEIPVEMITLEGNTAPSVTDNNPGENTDPNEPAGDPTPPGSLRASRIMVL